MLFSVDAGFDGGNIDVVAVRGDVIDLAIPRDRCSAFHQQLFFFRLVGAGGSTTRLRIVNASGAAFPADWPGYGVRASADPTT